MLSSFLQSWRGFGSGSKEAAERQECEARKHEEEEAGKASSLGFTSSDALCGF